MVVVGTRRVALVETTVNAWGALSTGNQRFLAGERQRAALVALIASV
jgi:hypothetical protein